MNRQDVLALRTAVRRAAELGAARERQQLYAAIGRAVAEPLLQKSHAPANGSPATPAPAPQPAPRQPQQPDPDSGSDTPAAFGPEHVPLAVALAMVDHATECKEWGDDPSPGLDALRKAARNPHALARLTGLRPDVAEKAYEIMVGKAAERAPKGGVTIGGTRYPGGRWIPSSAIAAASPAERAELAAAQHAGGTGSSGRAGQAHQQYGGWAQSAKEGHRTAPEHGDRMERAATAVNRSAEIAKLARSNPDHLTAEHVDELATHLPHLDHKQLTNLRAALTAKFGRDRDSATGNPLADRKAAFAKHLERVRSSLADYARKVSLAHAAESPATEPATDPEPTASEAEPVPAAEPAGRPTLPLDKLPPAVRSAVAASHGSKSPATPGNWAGHDNARRAMKRGVHGGEARSAVAAAESSPEFGQATSEGERGAIVARHLAEAGFGAPASGSPGVPPAPKPNPRRGADDAKPTDEEFAAASRPAAKPGPSLKPRLKPPGGGENSHEGTAEPAPTAGPATAATPPAKPKAAAPKASRPRHDEGRVSGILDAVKSKTQVGLGAHLRQGDLTPHDIVEAARRVGYSDRTPHPADAAHALQQAREEHESAHGPHSPGEDSSAPTSPNPHYTHGRAPERGNLPESANPRKPAPPVKTTPGKVYTAPKLDEDRVAAVVDQVRNGHGDLKKLRRALESSLSPRETAEAFKRLGIGGDATAARREMEARWTANKRNGPEAPPATEERPAESPAEEADASGTSASESGAKPAKPPAPSESARGMSDEEVGDSLPWPAAESKPKPTGPTRPTKPTGRYTPWEGSPPPPEANPAEPAPTKPPAKSPAKSAAHAALHDAIAKSEGLSPEQQDHYRRAVDRVATSMPRAAHDRLARHVKGATFHADTDELAKRAVASVLADPSLSEADREAVRRASGRLASGELRAGGAFHPKTGQLHVDGDFDGGHTGRHAGTAAQTHGIYAHELAHAIDGPDRALSKSPDWRAAAGAEIAHKAGAEPPLTRYATTKPSEGFAEFARLVYGSDVPHSQIEREFPRCAAFFKANGLWPESERDAPESKLGELFHERLAISASGPEHVDTTAPEVPAAKAASRPAPTPKPASKYEATVEQARRVIGNSQLAPPPAAGKPDPADFAARAEAGRDDPGITRALLDDLAHPEVTRDEVVALAKHAGGDALASAVGKLRKRADQVAAIRDHLHPDGRIDLMEGQQPGGGRLAKKVTRTAHDVSDSLAEFAKYSGNPDQTHEEYSTPAKDAHKNAHAAAEAVKSGDHALAGEYHKDAADAHDDAADGHDLWAGSDVRHAEAARLHRAAAKRHREAHAALAPAATRGDPDGDSNTDPNRIDLMEDQSPEGDREAETPEQATARFMDGYHGDANQSHYEGDPAHRRANAYRDVLDGNHPDHPENVDPHHFDEDMKRDITHDLSETFSRDLAEHLLEAGRDYNPNHPAHDIAHAAVDRKIAKHGAVPEEELDGDDHGGTHGDRHALVTKEDVGDDEAAWQAVRKAAKLLPGAVRTRVSGEEFVDAGPNGDRSTRFTDDSLIVKQGSPLHEAIKGAHGANVGEPLDSPDTAMRLFQTAKSGHEIPQKDVPASARDYGGTSGGLRTKPDDDETWNPQAVDVYRRLSPNLYVRKRSDGDPEVASGDRFQYELVHRSELDRTPLARLHPDYFRNLDADENTDDELVARTETRADKATPEGAKKKREMHESRDAIKAHRKRINLAKQAWHKELSGVPEDERPEEPDWHDPDTEVVNVNNKYEMGPRAALTEHWENREGHREVLSSLADEYATHADAMEKEVGAAREHAGKWLADWKRKNAKVAARLAPKPPDTPAAKARAALDAIGLPHAHLSDEQAEGFHDQIRQLHASLGAPKAADQPAKKAPARKKK